MLKHRSQTDDNAKTHCQLCLLLWIKPGTRDLHKATHRLRIKDILLPQLVSKHAHVNINSSSQTSACIMQDHMQKAARKILSSWGGSPRCVYTPVYAWMHNACIAQVWCVKYVHSTSQFPAPNDQNCIVLQHPASVTNVRITNKDVKL